jgi:DNA-binding NarL/FixJ family response regulator
MAEDELWQVESFEDRFLSVAGIEYLGNVPDYDEILPVVRTRRPDGLFLDLRWDGQPPLTPTRELLPGLRREFPRMIVFAFTNIPDLLAPAREMGAQRVLAKNDVGTVDLMRAALCQFFELPPEPLRLTAQERKVLEWVAEGKTNAQIAEQMTVSERTVKYHLKQSCVKLGAHNRGEAVHLARQTGDLPRVPRRTKAPDR